LENVLAARLWDTLGLTLRRFKDMVESTKPRHYRNNNRCRNRA
jgi:hypothetical protein